MALQGIGNGASPLDRFQQVRDLAKKKLDADENRTRLADLLKRKQAELGHGLAPDRPQAAARRFETPAAGALPGGAAAGGLAAYGRAGAMEKPDPRPGLGRRIDLTA